MRYVRRILLHPAASLRAARPPIRPSPSPRHPCRSPLQPHVPPSSTGGSNGCGGICQAVTHPHGRILGYVFARSLPPAFHPSVTSSLSLSSFPRFHPPVPPRSPRFSMYGSASIRPSVHTRPRHPRVHFSPPRRHRELKKGESPCPPPRYSIRADSARGNMTGILVMKCHVFFSGASGTRKS